MTLRSIAVTSFLSLVWVGSALGAGGPGPIPAPPAAEISPPQDRPFPGVIALSIDATDTARKIVRIHETIPVSAGEMTLLYPQWLPGTHAPEGAIDRVAGIAIKAGGRPIGWTRDPVDVYAFHLTVPPGAGSLDIEFQYLSPVDDQTGGVEITSSMMDLEFIRLALYPAGYFSRQIQVAADVTLPAGWQYATALDGASATGGHIAFRTTTFNTLADSPIYAGKYFSRLDLDPGAKIPVHLDIMADRPSLLEVTPEQLASHRR